MNKMIDPKDMKDYTFIDLLPYSDSNLVNAVSQATDRFLSFGSLLTEDQRLGWQMELCSSPVLQLFHSASLPMEAEDSRWIFESYAEPKAQTAKTEETSEFKKYYIIRNCPEPIDEDEPMVEMPSAIAPQPREHSLPLFQELARSHARLRLLQTGSRPGAVLLTLELSQGISLRLHAMLCSALPGVRVHELTLTDDGFLNLADEYWIEGSRKVLLNGILFSAYTRFLREKRQEELSRTPVSDEDPIDVLNLTLRTYNCLRRAGIHTVGDLRKLEMLDLVHIRNLGQKSQVEVLETMKRLKNQPEPADSQPASQETPAAETVTLPQPAPAEMLEKLIGLTEVKKQVKRIAAFARLKKDMASRGMQGLPIALHMSFEGNPGTAKTTVARILAEILHQEGILESKEILEVGRSDLVGQYVGHTAAQVKQMFQKAQGRLLFIDEAYALADKNNGSFGEEAIAAIVQEMENRRDSTVVVFAGYPKEMEQLFSVNPGLNSRVPFHIQFPDYDTRELLAITRLESSRRNFSLSPEAEERVAGLCEQIVGSEHAGNGRFCRNLVENAILNYASRLYRSGGEEIAHDFILTPEDIELPAQIGERPKAPIGFHAAC